MKMMTKAILLGFLIFSFIGCSKPMVTGKDVAMEPVIKSFNAPREAVFEAANQALRDMKYKVEYADLDQGALRTGWVPTTADSHYIELFGREDYGVTNAYYHLAVRLSEEDDRMTVEVSAPLRTIIAKMHSSHRQEKKFLSKMKDFLRPADFKVTNIGTLDD